MARTGIGIIGTGRMATVHALAAATAGIPVVEVAGRPGGDVDAVVRFATEAGARVVAGPAAFTAPLVVVASPTEAHDEQVERLIDAGHDVLVELPVATDPTVISALDQRAAARGVTVRAAEHLAHSPLVRAALARRSALGPARHLSVRVTDDSPAARHHGVWLAVVLAAEAPVAHTRRGPLTEITFASGLVATITVLPGQWDAQLATDIGVIRIDGSGPTLEINGEPVTIPLRHKGGDPRLDMMGFVAQIAELVDPDATRRPGVPLGAAAVVVSMLTPG